jgi:c-di-GMP-binding flagellar brake protein YcgR
MAERTISPWGQLLDVHPPSVGSFASRTERRAWLRYACDLATNYRLTQPSDESKVPARVRNICAGGINVLVDQPLQRGTILSVELPGAMEQLPSSVLACVIHSAPWPAGYWTAGCALVAELGDDELQRVGAKRLLSPPADQRKWVRFPCDLPSSYRRIRVTERQHTSARVIDISASGVGLLVSHFVNVGTLLSLQLCGPDGQLALTILACVVRIAAHTDGQWILGCNFIRELTDKELEPLKMDSRARAKGSC